MTFAWVLFVLECAVIAVNSGYLVWHEDYEDGLIGRLALALGISLPGGIIFFEALLSLIHGTASLTSGVPGVIAWFGLGAMLFLVRHTARWWEHRCAAHGWKTEHVSRRLLARL